MYFILSKCQVSISNPSCMEWMCEIEECLVDQNMLDNLVQSQNYLDWIPGNYSQFWGKTLQDGQSGKLGTDSTLVSIFFSIWPIFRSTSFIICLDNVIWNCKTYQWKLHSINNYSRVWMKRRVFLCTKELMILPYLLKYLF